MQAFALSFPRFLTAGILTGFYTGCVFLIVINEHAKCFQDTAGDFHFCGFGTALGLYPGLMLFSPFLHGMGLADVPLSVKLAALLIQSFCFYLVFAVIANIVRPRH